MELMEKICLKQNLYEAYKCLWRNKGSGCVDGIGLDTFVFQLHKEWENTKISSYADTTGKGAAKVQAGYPCNIACYGWTSGPIKGSSTRRAIKPPIVEHRTG